jgi:hypothetical protein
MATISCAGKEDAAPLQTSGDAERGSSTSIGVTSDGRWCWDRRLGASVVVFDGEGHQFARVTCPGHGGASTVPPPHPRRAPWPVPPRPHACRRARMSPRPSTGAATPACHLARAPVPPRPHITSPERRLLLAPRASAVLCRLTRAHGGGRDWGGPHGEEGRRSEATGVKRRKRKEGERKNKGRGKKRK